MVTLDERLTVHTKHAQLMSLSQAIQIVVHPFEFQLLLQIKGMGTWKIVDQVQIRIRIWYRLEFWFQFVS